MVNISKEISIHQADPTLPRYGTDFFPTVNPDLENKAALLRGSMFLLTRCSLNQLIEVRKALN